MSIVGSKIVRPVGIADLRTMFGTDSGDEGTLCVHPAINKWARYKPVRRAGYVKLSYAVRAQEMFGLRVPYCQYDTMNGMVHDIMTGEDDGWGYSKPQGDMTGTQGGVKEFYRMTDLCPDPTDTDDPNYGQSNIGYRHDAPVPFTVSLDNTGITRRGDGTLEINIQERDSLTFTFGNSVNADLTLQDLVDLTYDESGKAWRPVVQVFKASEDDEWYERSQPVVQVAGNAIKDGGTISVTLPLAGLIGSEVEQSDVYHLCIGVGCCNSTCTEWKDSTSSLFPIPYTTEQEIMGEWPFYMKFQIANYMNNEVLNVTGLRYGNQDAVRDNGTFHIPAGTEGTIWLTMSFLRQSRDLEFVWGNDQPTSGYTDLSIEIENNVTGYSEFVSPRNSSWQSGVHIYIPAATETGQRQTIYGTPLYNNTTSQIDVGNIPNGGYMYFQVYARIGGSYLTKAARFTIHKMDA